MTLPVLSIQAIRGWEEASWRNGRSQSAVIQQVGFRVAQWLMQHSSAGQHLLLLAGKGHNGDDVRAAVPHLRDRSVRLVSVTDPDHDSTRVTEALLRRPAWVVDGLFGTGLNRPLQDSWIQLLESVNRSGCRVVSVDIPSGLNADSGEPQGAAIKAAFTLAIGAPKSSFATGQAFRYTGRIEVIECVGLNSPPEGEANEPRWVHELDFRGFPPARLSDSNKGTHGHLAVLAGSPGFHGAAILCARGAQLVQPGLVTVLTHPDVYACVGSNIISGMVGSWAEGIVLPAKCSAIVAGPGLAAAGLEQVQLHVQKLWADSRLPMVVDATALGWLPRMRMRMEIASDAVRVMTPHPGEAARLLGISVSEVQSDRMRALRELSGYFGGCWVVLKGQGTLIGRVEGPVWCCARGCPEMAQGGTGDVLAGMLGGLIAQSGLLGDIRRLLSFGVWLHGAIGESLTLCKPGWNAFDMANTIRGEST